MKYMQESDIKKALGVDSLENLSEENIERFGVMMPDMNEEVALAIIAQYPQFTKFAGRVVQSVERAHEATVQSNADGEARHQEIQLEVLKILQGQLDRDLPAEERIRVTDYVKDISDKSFDKDSESKRFLESLMDRQVLSQGLTVVAALVFLGGKFFIDRRPPRI